MKQPTTFGIAWNRMLLCQRTLCIRQCGQCVYKETGPWSSGGVLTNRLYWSSSFPIGQSTTIQDIRGQNFQVRRKKKCSPKPLLFLNSKLPKKKTTSSLIHSFTQSATLNVRDDTRKYTITLTANEGYSRRYNNLFWKLGLSLKS